MPQKLLYALALIVLCSFVISTINRRRRAAVWSGTVTEIRHQRSSVIRDEDRRAEEWVRVFYRTDGGVNGKLKLRMASMRGYLPGLQPGDRLVKSAGNYLPRKVQAEPDSDSVTPPSVSEA